MARYVIDAPTLLHLVDHALPVDPGHQLVAPNWIRSEALQLLLDEVRSGGRTEKDALACHERLTEVKMRLLGDRVSRRTAWRVAVEQGWESLEPAEYVAITRLQADALVSVDPDLHRQVGALVPLASVEDLLGRG
ncbi:hypothetical protein [Nocardioides pacificus]